MDGDVIRYVATIADRNSDTDSVLISICFAGFGQVLRVFGRPFAGGCTLPLGLSMADAHKPCKPVKTSWVPLNRPPQPSAEARLDILLGQHIPQPAGQVGARWRTPARP